MFLSKIWFFLVAAIAAVAITIALVMPRPAERAAAIQESKNVRTACLVTKILLEDNARARIQLTSEFAQAVRELKLSNTLAEASKNKIVTGEANATSRKELAEILKDVDGTKPSFIWLLDLQGRVVARSNVDDPTYGDSMRGYYLVQDALDGYVRDDLWMMADGLYRVAAAPVLTRDLDWAGAIVIGQSVDQAFASSLGENIGTEINFYVGKDNVASSKPIQIHLDVIAGSAELSDLDKGQDCAASKILHVTAGNEDYAVVSARLPGEAGLQGAFYSVYIQQARPLNFMGTLKSVKKDDLGFGQFPWPWVAVLFIGLVGIGFFLMMREVDTPLKRLGKDAVALAQGDKERFDEEAHRSKYGSIARSVNIAIDKMQRDAKAARKDLDQLLGPAPQDGGHDAPASALPPIGPGGGAGAFNSPPPSEFKFGGAPSATDLGLTPPPPAAGMPGLTAAAPAATPAPFDNLAGLRGNAPRKAPEERTPPPIPSKRPVDDLPFKRPTDSQVVPDPVSLPAGAIKSIEADILGDEDEQSEATQPFKEIRGEEDELPTVAPTRAFAGAYFQEVYEQFIALKMQCGESIESLSFDRFAQKLEKNQEALIAKHGCKSVKFQVYEKDGKAALKASPIR